MKKGFGLVGIIIALAVVILAGSGGSYWKEMRNQKAEELRVGNESENRVDILSWKIYRNEQYGFEMKYPSDWKLDSNKLVIESPNHDEIRLFVSGVDRTFSVDCPVMTHEVECINKVNSRGIRLARSVNTGQLQHDKQEQLSAFLNVGEADIQMVMIITDERGIRLSNYSSNSKIFDEILDTIGAGTDTVGWKTYRNEQYGFEVRYPSDWLLDTHGGDGVLEKLYEGDLRVRQWLYPNEIPKPWEILIMSVGVEQGEWFEENGQFQIYVIKNLLDGGSLSENYIVERIRGFLPLGHEITLFGNRAWVYADICDSKHRNEWSATTYVANGGKLYYLSAWVSKESVENPQLKIADCSILGEILSSFRFIQ